MSTRIQRVYLSDYDRRGGCGCSRVGGVDVAHVVADAVPCAWANFGAIETMLRLTERLRGECQTKLSISSQAGGGWSRLGSVLSPTFAIHATTR